ncbi:ATP-grasp domain-containing protein [Shivajiella indica]|uniref:ATP-grasp domain-containing protein n=1 Tax=Shivajiella indica TaxID=872115 RepID=A0ABW5BCQ9_9BACT
MRVLIPDGESGHAIAVAQSLLLNEEVELYIMAQKKNPPSKFLKGCKAFKWIETTDEKSYLESILKFAFVHKVNIILPIDEASGKVFSQYKDYVEKFIPIIPLPELETFHLVTNKRLLAEFCIKNEIPVPMSWKLSEFNKELQVNDVQLFPTIIKPECGNGGKNIQLIKSKEEYLEIDFESLNKDFGDYFVQEFIEGYDIDMSVLCMNGQIKAYTIQKALLGRKSKFAAAAGIEFLENNELKKVVEKLMLQLCYSGIAHLDLRFDKKTNEYKLIEINSRFWGSLLGSTKAGVNFPYLCCKVRFNEEFEIPKYSKNRYFDIFSLLKRPYFFRDYNVKIKETNANFLFNGFLANAVNVFNRG